MFNELNKRKAKVFDFDTDNDVFMNLGEYFELIEEDTEKITPIKGFFFFDTEYGKSGAVVIDGNCIYIPLHQVETFEDIIEDVEMVKAINKGKCGFKVRPYKKRVKEGKKYKTKDCYSFELCDI